MIITDSNDKWINYHKSNIYYTNMDDFYYNPEIEHITEIVKNKLYFGSTYGDEVVDIKSTIDTLYFTTDEELIYVNYYYDFGPLNLSCLYKFCCQLNAYLCTPNIKRVVYYSSGDQNKRANAAHLIGSFSIIYLNMMPRRIYQLLTMAGGAFRNFVDASQGLSNYTIRLIDCFHAIEKAKAFKFFDFEDFNVLDYDNYDKIHNGDMNWILPRKFLAFIGPTECEFMNGHPPEFYVKYFLKNDVKTVVRLNNKVYNASVFTDAGIDHHELFFPDGTTPPKHILLRFLDLCESSPAAIGVHCKAGLGRTGSLIGAYIIKHYKMSAREIIAWMRICRPGSVIGQQQGWLEKIESWLWRQGYQYRIHHYGDGDKIPHHRYGIYSKEWPLERRRLILEAHRSLMTQEKDSPKLKQAPSQRASAPPVKQLSSNKANRPGSERRSNIEKDYQKPSKVTVKREQLEVNDENSQTNSKRIFEYPFLLNNNELRKKLKDLGNAENANGSRTKDRLISERTQGDRLIDIKSRRQSGVETKNRAMNKNKLVKKEESFISNKTNGTVENFIYRNKNSNPMYYNMQETYTTSQHNRKRFETDHPRLVKNVIN